MAGCFSAAPRIRRCDRGPILRRSIKTTGRPTQRDVMRRRRRVLDTRYAAAVNWCGSVQYTDRLMATPLQSELSPPRPSPPNVPSDVDTGMHSSLERAHSRTRPRVRALFSSRFRRCSRPLQMRSAGSVWNLCVQPPHSHRSSIQWDPAAVRRCPVIEQFATSPVRRKKRVYTSKQPTVGLVGLYI